MLVTHSPATKPIHHKMSNSPIPTCWWFLIILLTEQTFILFWKTAHYVECHLLGCDAVWLLLELILQKNIPLKHYVTFHKTIFFIMKTSNLTYVHYVPSIKQEKTLNKPPNSKELSPPWEAVSCAATLKISRILSNQKVHCQFTRAFY
jgi:hypothetical protein